MKGQIFNLIPPLQASPTSPQPGASGRFRRLLVHKSPELRYGTDMRCRKKVSGMKQKITDNEKSEKKPGDVPNSKQKRDRMHLL